MTTQTKQCIFSPYEYPCDKTDCRGCPIMTEFQAKANEEIIENLKSYWANLNAGSADWRG